MDPVSSSTRIPMSNELEQCPRTPRQTEFSLPTPSSRKRDRFLDVFKFMSRTSHTVIDEHETSRPPIQKRKSVINLFASLRSRQRQEKAEYLEESTIRRARSISPFKKSQQVEPFDDNRCEPKRRKSLGDIVGTLTHKMSQKQRNLPQNTDEVNPSAYNSIEVIEATSPPEDRVDSASSRYLDIFQSNLERMVDDFKEMEARRLRGSSAESSTLSSDSWSSGVRTLGSQGGLDDRHENEGESRCHTPDSYLQLLVEASKTPPKGFSPLRGHEDISETPSPSKLKAVEPIDFLDDASLNDYYGQSREVHSYREDNYDYQKSGVFVCPKGWSFDDFRLQETRPVVSVREVDPFYDFDDLDLCSNQRLDEKNERYWHSDTKTTSELQVEIDEIAKRIKLTVAKMTQNYHFISSFEDSWPEFPIAQSAQPVQPPVDGFENDQAEVWDSIIHGSNILQQSMPCRSLKNTPSSRNISHRASIELTLEETIRLRTPVDPDMTDYKNAGNEKRPNLPLTNIDNDIVLPGISTPQIYSKQQILSSFSISELDLDGEEACASEDFDFTTANNSIFKEEQSGSQRQKKPTLRASKFGRLRGSVTVRFPGTVNLLPHFEEYSSKRKALSALFDYKLGDLSNFYTYDSGQRIIFAHSLDEAVPNPAELKKKGLELIWLPSHQAVLYDSSRDVFAEMDLNGSSDICSFLEESSSKLECYNKTSSMSNDSTELRTQVRDEDAERRLISNHNLPRLASEDENCNVQVDPKLARSFLISQYSEELDIPFSQDGSTSFHGTWPDFERTSLEGYYTDSDESLRVQYTRSPVVREESSSTRSFPSTYSARFSDKQIWSFLSQNENSVEGSGENHEREIIRILARVANPRCTGQVENEVDLMSRPLSLLKTPDWGITENHLLEGNLRLSSPATGKPTYCGIRLVTPRKRHLLDEDVPADTPDRKFKHRTSSNWIFEYPPVSSKGNLAVNAKKSKKFSSKRRYRQRSSSMESFSFSCGWPKSGEYDGLNSFENTRHKRACSAASISSLPIGFKFTAYADQFDEISTGEEQENLHNPGVHATEVGKQATIRQEAFRRFDKTFEILDLNDAEEAPAEEGQAYFKSTGPLHLSHDQNEAFKSLTSEDLNIRFVGRAAREIQKSSPKVGALVEIFQARGIMPQSLKSGLQNAHLQASQLPIIKKKMSDPSTSGLSFVE